MALAPGTRLGIYEITAPIGEGGMGAVYRATDTSLGRQVAIKVLPDAFAQDAERLARFEREAKTLAALNHPHIAAIYGFERSSPSTGSGQAVPALVMELVEGEDLSQRIARGPIPLDEALPIAKQIADALEAAHEQGIIHRDLKPANIKVRADGTVKVLDFGLAKAAGPPEGGHYVQPGMSLSPTITSPAMMTGGGMILGTAAYMAPEQARGKTIDRRADIWAFGVVLFEMLAGTRAFPGEDITDTLAAVVRSEPRWDALPPTVPARVSQALRVCLRKDPKDRVSDIRDVRLALEGAFETPASAAPAERAAQSRKGRERLAQVVAAAAIVIASGIAVLHFRETPPPQQTLRYTLNVPARTLHSFAMSPDGRHVAMATLGNEKRQLWLRSLDALEAQPVPFTEGATYPFWSPDSRNIGFFADGKLKTVAAAGGPAQTLCDAPSGRGGSWSRDDVIVFAPIAGGNTLQRVAAGGGVPVDVLTTKDVPRFPVFLPDGRRFLYLFREDDAQVAVYVASLDGTENRRIRVVSSPPLFAPGGRIGHLLFLNQSTLMALPFDASSAEAAGDVFPVAENVDQANGLLQATVSASSVLVYERSGTTAALNQISWFDRTGKLLGPLGAPSPVSAPVISQDEKSVIFQRHANSSGNANPGDLWLRDLNRGTETRLTSDSSNGFAVWSPKGDRIVFGSDRKGVTNLYQRAANGSGQDEVMLTSTVQHTPTQWSRDGRFIVYSQRDNPESLWVLPLEAGAAEHKPALFLKTQFNTGFGQLSPDSRWMAFVSEKSGRRDVYVRPFPSGEGEWTVSIAGGQAPRWRADGKELFFVAPDGTMMAVPVSAVAGARPSFDAGVPVPLFETNMVQRAGRPVYQYDVTADGKRFLIANAVDTRDAAAPPLTVVTNWQAGLNK